MLLRSSHGFLPKLINPNSLLQIQHQCSDLLTRTSSSPSYISNLHKCLPDVLLLSDSKCMLDTVSSLLSTESPALCNVELHTQLPGGEPIPYHQDNFYHCIKNGLGVKILIPLTPLTPDSGGLSFLNIPSDYPVLNHRPSDRKHFSSYIEPSLVAQLGASSQSYVYKLGDASYHYLNSVHSSATNQTNSSTMFLVYRYHHPDAEVSAEMSLKYNDVYQAHVGLIN